MAIFKTHSELIWGSRRNERFCEAVPTLLGAAVAPLMPRRGRFRHDRPAKPSSRLLERLKLLLAANRLIHPLSQDWQTHLIRLLWGSPVRLEIVSLSPSR